jgi:hypothetical protein
LQQSNDQACKNNNQEQLGSQMHRIWSKMIAKGREYFCGVGEHPMVNLLPMIGGTKEIWDPPRVNLKIEPPTSTTSTVSNTRGQKVEKEERTD